MTSEFCIYTDARLTQPSAYNAHNAYVIQARHRLDTTFEFIAAAVPGAKMLDIGASPFYLLDRALQEGAKEACGVYFSNDDHPFRELSSIYSKNGTIEIHHNDLEKENLPFDDNTFDVVTACEVLEHFGMFPARFASEVRRVLRPGGLLCITVPNAARASNVRRLLTGQNVFMRYCNDPTARHHHEYVLPQLAALIRYMGMDVMQIGYLPAHTSRASWKSTAYELMAKLPLLRRFSPVLIVTARQPLSKDGVQLGAPPPELYSGVRATENDIDTD